MKFSSLGIEGAWLGEPRIREDSRGLFLEVFRLDEIRAELGREFSVKQVNQSVSRKGVVRGIHFSGGPYGQAKYVSCSRGSIWDVVVDLRTESKSFGEWRAVELNQQNKRCVFIGEGFGHAFLALEDNSLVSYLCSEAYSPQTEFSLNPFDVQVGVPFHEKLQAINVGYPILSAKDSSAPGLSELLEAGVLPAR
jgi:dTDP-4-dehydrorhamnose 3,5-epimerase